MKSYLLAFLAVVTVVSAAVGGTTEAPALVVVGAGYTGTFDTEVLLSNPFDTPLEVLVGRSQIPCVIGTCPPPIPVDAEIPANGQIAIAGSAITNGAIEVSYFYVVAATEGQAGLPVVRARSFNIAQPSLAMELPVVSYAALVNRGAAPLSFPGGERSSTAHSNLILAEVSDGAPLTVHIEAIDTAGHSVGATDRSLQPGQWIFLVDVLNTLGIDSFAGQLRVTQTGGNGVLNGVLATLTTDGRVSVSPGFNP